MTTSTKSRAWTFTINNWTDNDHKLMVDLEKKFMVMGKETGENGTPHLQGTIIFKNQLRLSALKKIHKTAHWEPVVCEEASVNYCFKDQDYVKQDYRAQGKRTDLDTVVKNIKTLGLKKAIDENPIEYIKFHAGMEKLAFRSAPDRDFKPYIEWIYGPTGVGKSRYVFEKIGTQGWWSSKTLKWWDGYENQEAICIDDFRGDFCTFHELLRILDRYPYNVEVKGGYRKFNSKVIYITSYCHPKDVYETREDIDQLLRRIDKIHEIKKPAQNKIEEYIPAIPWDAKPNCEFCYRE